MSSRNSFWRCVSWRSEYVSKRGKSGLIFVAPHTNEISDVTGIPSQFNLGTAPAVVVYNLKDGAEDLAPIIHARHSLSRLWGGKENSLSYTSNLIRCVNFIALYDYKQTAFNNGRMDGTFE